MDAAGHSIAQGRRSGKLSRLVARQLLEDIAHRNLQPRDRLGSETELMERFGVGRAALREGLRLLEAHGVISIRSGPGGGPAVDSIDGRDFGRTATLFFFLSETTYEEVVEARLVMDPVMARLAAQRRSSDGIQQLQELTRQADGLVEDDDQLAGVASDFHRSIAGMSGNGVLDLYGRGLIDVYSIRFPQRLVYPPDLLDHVRSVHKDITQAVVEGAADRAENLMRSHLEEFVDFVRSKYPSILEEVVEWL